jgi:hypothetical protein
LQCGGKNIRFVVMNNLLPSSVRMHEKYDLKGSTYKRKASRKEKQKKSPTLKDLDFLENHPEGIMLEAETYAALINTISRDCRVRAHWNCTVTQGSILRTVRLPGTTKSGCRASRFPCKLARQSIKSFAFLLIYNTGKNLFQATSFNLIHAQRTSGSIS